MSLQPTSVLPFLSKHQVSRVRLFLVVYVFASMVNWEQSFKIKILPLHIHNVGNLGSHRFAWYWSRSYSLLKDCRIVTRSMLFVGASIGNMTQ
jgi:hypothetical protein